MSAFKFKTIQNRRAVSTQCINYSFFSYIYFVVVIGVAIAAIVVKKCKKCKKKKATLESSDDGYGELQVSRQSEWYMSCIVRIQKILVNKLLN